MTLENWGKIQKSSKLPETFESEFLEEKNEKIQQAMLNIDNFDFKRSYCENGVVIFEGEKKEDGTIIKISFEKGKNYETPFEKKGYQARETVNNTEIICEWDEAYDDYILYLPKLKISEESQEGGVNDNAFIIKGGSENAKKVFEYTKKLAQSEENQMKIYIEAMNFAEEVSS